MKAFIKKRLHSPGRIVLWLLCSVCLSLATLASSEVLRQAVAAVEHADLSGISQIIWLAVLTTLWVIVFEYLNRTTSQDLRNRFGTQLQLTLLRHTLGIDKLSFSQRPTGKTLTLLQDNVESAVNGTLGMLEEIVYGVGLLVFSMIYMGVLSWQLMLVIVACNIIFRILTRFFDGKIRSFSKRVIGHISESNSFFMEILRNELLVRVYDREEYFEKEFEKREKNVARTALAVFGTSNGYSEITWYASTLMTLVFIYGVGGTFMLRGMFEFSVLIAFTKAMDSFVKGMNSIISAINYYNNALPHIQAIEETLNAPCEVSDTADTKLEVGDICFNDVSFGFPDKPIFEHLNLTIHKGDHVMIAGANGRGKSTLFGLLLGFYRPQSGTITINGIDIANYSTEKLCRIFGYVPQQAHIFYGSVEENMALTQSKNAEKTENILQELHLENVVSADPLRCSMGEKQRINIGRALYHDDRDILLGDEIFANIDAANRYNILKVLTDFGQDKTVLLICHEDFAYSFTHRLVLGENEITYTRMEVAR